MKITPENKTLATVLQIGSPNIYSIPIYQRNYSWKEDQIETLFNDIKEEDLGYYVGNLLITAEDKSMNIIDGQQRITTLLLFLLAIFEKVSSLIKDNVDNDVESLYEIKTDIKRQISIPEKNGILRLKLLDKDDEILNNLTHSIFEGVEPSRWGKYSFYKRYKFITGKLFSDIETRKDISDFYNKLINIELLQISVHDLSDAYQVFASLNSKGLPLTPLDLLKNVFLGNRGDINKWDKLRDLFSPNEELNDSKMTQFVLNNYDAFENMKTTSSMTKGQLVKLYSNVFKSEEYIDTLIENAKIFKTIANSEYTKYDYTLSGLSQLDSTTSYPLLMYILKEKEKLELNDIQMQEIISNLINFYVRRNVALVPKSSNVRQKLFELKNNIFTKKLKSDNIVKSIQQCLLELSPNDELMRTSLEDGIYDKNKKTSRFILVNLERNDTNYFHKGNPDTLDKFNEDTNKRIWEIEHILPQTLNNEWRNEISPNDISKAEAIKNDVVHLLGNLTLTPYNSGLGNSSFKSKLEYRDKKTLVGLNLNIFRQIASLI